MEHRIDMRNRACACIATDGCCRVSHGLALMHIEATIQRLVRSVKYFFKPWTTSWWLWLGRKAAKAMLEERDLHKFASVLASAPVEKKWVASELAVAAKSKQVAGAIITEVVLDLDPKRDNFIIVNYS